MEHTIYHLTKEHRQKTEDELRRATEIDRELREKNPDLETQDSDVEDDENDDDANGYNSAKETPEETTRDLGYTEKDKITYPAVRDIQTKNKPGSKRELRGSSDDVALQPDNSV